MKIKKDDQVVIIKGKDRGKKGKVVQVFGNDNKLVVEGANKYFKHLKARKGKEKGERVEFSAPMYASNVLFLCPKCNKPARLGRKMQDKKSARVCRKCKAII